MTTERYHIKQFARERWHVIGPSGVVYHGGRGYMDRPIIFQDYDKAVEFAERCNQQEEEEESTPTNNSNDTRPSTALN